MNTFAIVALFAALATTSLVSSAQIVQGPSSRTTVVGPDGSSISSVAPGGTIISEDHAPVVAHTAYAAHAAPAVAHTAYAAYAAPAAYATYAAPAGYATYAAPAAYATYAAPVAYHGHGVISTRSVDTRIAGPSGTIETSRNIDTPAHGQISSYAAYPAASIYAGPGGETRVAGPSGTIETGNTHHGYYI